MSTLPPPPPPGPGWNEPPSPYAPAPMHEPHQAFALRPAVVGWYTVYCVVMALLYILVVAMGVLILAVDPAAMEMDPVEQTFMGSVYLGVGLVLFIPFAAAPFLPRAKWVWVYHLVLICIGLTSCCTIPACIPLLIGWLKPETKAYFGWM